MKKQILLNIGNTHIQVGMLDGGRVSLLERYDTADVKVLGCIPLLDNMPVEWQASAVSVVPLVRQALELRYAEKIHFLSHKDFAKLDFSLVDVSTLGMDRIANAAAAYESVRSAVAVIDFGTCINMVAVNERGQFLGGSIMPGRMLLRKSLSTYTAQLPFLPIRSELPPPIGTKTLDAIASGVDLGVIGAVKELMAATRMELNMPDCRFLSAGGDAPYFLEHIPELEKGQELLTLRGVAAAIS